MSDLLSYMYSLYDDYKLLCKDKGIVPIDMEDSKWTKQLTELENEQHQDISRVSTGIITND